SSRVVDRSRCRSCAAWRISRLVSVKRRPTSTSAWAISPINAWFASRTVSVALRLSLPAVRLIASKLSMMPLVAEAVFSVSALLLEAGDDVADPVEDLGGDRLQARYL